VLEFSPVACEPLKETQNETKPRETYVEPGNDQEPQPNCLKRRNRHPDLRVRTLHLPAAAIIAERRGKMSSAFGLCQGMTKELAEKCVFRK